VNSDPSGLANGLSSTCERHRGRARGATTPRLVTRRYRYRSRARSEFLHSSSRCRRRRQDPLHVFIARRRGHVDARSIDVAAQQRCLSSAPPLKGTNVTSAPASEHLTLSDVDAAEPRDAMLSLPGLWRPQSSISFRLLSGCPSQRQRRVVGHQLTEILIAVRLCEDSCPRAEPRLRSAIRSSPKGVAIRLGGARSRYMMSPSAPGLYSTTTVDRREIFSRT